MVTCFPRKNVSLGCLSPFSLQTLSSPPCISTPHHGWQMQTTEAHVVRDEAGIELSEVSDHSGGVVQSQPQQTSAVAEVVGRTPVDSMVRDDNNCLVTRSPRGTTYWTPLCDENLTPKRDQIFPSLDDGIMFYRHYAAECNFEVRLGKNRVLADGCLRAKYVLCNKEGSSRVRPQDTLSTNSGVARRISMTRCKCNAKILLSKHSKGYVVSEFFSAHNHELATVTGTQFMKCRRSLSFAQMNLVAACGR